MKITDTVLYNYCYATWITSENCIECTYIQCTSPPPRFHTNFQFSIFFYDTLRITDVCFRRLPEAVPSSRSRQPWSSPRRSTLFDTSWNCRPALHRPNVRRPNHPMLRGWSDGNSYFHRSTNRWVKKQIYTFLRGGRRCAMIGFVRAWFIQVLCYCGVRCK